eukprot:EG_transcript_22109
MQVHRRKQSNKVLAWYKKEYGYDPPFRVLCDAAFIGMVLDNGWKLERTVQRALGLSRPSSLRVCCCKPVRDELSMLGRTDALEAAQWLYSVSTYHTGYGDGNLSPSDALLALAKDSERKYILATQNDQLRWAAHKKCIPVVRFDDLKKAVMLDGFLYSKKVRKGLADAAPQRDVQLSKADAAFIQRLQQEMGVKEPAEPAPKKAKRVWVPKLPQPRPNVPDAPAANRKTRRAGRKHRKGSVGAEGNMPLDAGAS